MFLLVTQWQKKGVFDLCDAIITERRRDFRRKSGDRGWRPCSAPIGNAARWNEMAG